MTRTPKARCGMNGTPTPPPPPGPDTPPPPPGPKSDDRLWTIDDLAAWAQVHPQTVREWVAGRSIPFTSLASRTADGRPSTRLVRFAPEHRAAIVAMGERLPVETHAARLLPDATHPPPGAPTAPPPSGPPTPSKEAATHRRRSA
jgi:hypothetical protein